jgi:tetratricopeptide (TPR) repeat protein
VRVRARLALIASLGLLVVAQLSRPGPGIRSQIPLRPYESLTCGGEALLADYYWFDLLQYYGGYRLGQNDLSEFIARAERLMRLDPGFHRANIFASVIRAQTLEDPEGAIQWLRHNERANPRTWEYPYEQGFLHYLYLGKYESAVADFRRAGKIAGAPPAWRHFVARITELGGDPRISRVMWLQISETAEHPAIRERALKNVRRLEAILLRQSQDSMTES